MSLTQIIKDSIRRNGSMTIADYMQLCLGHPLHGYYIKQDPFGTRGDFITAPEISQIFGELMGLWCADMWSQGGCEPAALVELGPGRGTLMLDALRATRNLEDFHDSISVHFIETSPILQNVQFHALQNAHDRLEWLDSVDELPEKPCFIIANEFFDALPIRQHVQTAQGIKERRVGIDSESGELCFTLEGGGLSLAKADGAIKEGTVIESCQMAKDILGRIATHLRRFGGALLMIDYGYLGEAHQNTLQAVKEHAYHPVLAECGDADITAHVDFNTLAEVAKAGGLAVHGPVDQGTFLVRLGAEMRVEALLQHATHEQAELVVSGAKRLIDPAQMGSLFKVMALCSDTSFHPAGFYAPK